MDESSTLQPLESQLCAVPDRTDVPDSLLRAHNVITAIEQITGLDVVEVNINVNDVHIRATTPRATFSTRPVASGERNRREHHRIGLADRLTLGLAAEFGGFTAFLPVLSQLLGRDRD